MPPSRKSSQKKFDFAPESFSLKNEVVPKSVVRVLDAQKIRDNFRKKKKRDDEDITKDQPSKKRRKKEAASLQRPTKVGLILQPGESLQHFNERVENDLRPGIQTAMQTARATERSIAKQEREDRTASAKNKSAHAKRTDIPDESKLKDTHDKDVSPSPSPKEFATALPKRFNDVAQAPPEFDKLPRGASSIPSKKRNEIMPMAQKLLMEREREKVIQRYRQLRAGQRREKGHE